MHSLLISDMVAKKKKNALRAVSSAKASGANSGENSLFFETKYAASWPPRNICRGLFLALLLLGKISVARDINGVIIFFFLFFCLFFSLSLLLRFTFLSFFSISIYFISVYILLICSLFVFSFPLSPILPSFALYPFLS